MHFKTFSFLFFITLSTVFRAQRFTDFAFILHENTINKVFTAIGEIKGTNEYEVLYIKGHYDWTVINPKINLMPDSSSFTCDAKVNVGPFNYKTQVVGHVKIVYDNAKNQISIKIARAIFELYTMVFGKKVHIKDIHLEEYFKDPFVFEGPKSFATDMEFTMPDSTMKKIYVQPTDCIMKVVKQSIVTSCDVAASDKPFKSTVKPQLPIQTPPLDKPKDSTSTTSSATATPTPKK